MTETQKKTWEVYESIIKLRGLSAVALTLASTYVVARAVGVAAEHVKPYAGIGQISVEGLSFSFLGMSLIWPLVIGLFATAYAFLGEREESSRSLLRGDPTLASLSDVLSLGSSLGQSIPGLRLRRVVCTLPIAAIFVHTASLSVYILRFVWVRSSDGWTLLLDRDLVATVVCFVTAYIGLRMTSQSLEINEGDESPLRHSSPCGADEAA